MKYTIDPIVIAKYRSELMGFAIMWIFLLHSGGCDIPIYDSVVSYGWMGVDIFFFLSALGLSYSLNKCKTKEEFYIRRVIRILPTWLLVLFIIHILGILIVTLLPKVPYNYPHTFVQAFFWYTGLGYWVNGILDNPLCYYYEWYIPTIFVFYIVSPFIYNKKIKTLCFWLIISILVSMLLTSNEVLYSLRLTHQRIPVFILGFLFYKVINSDKKEWYFLNLNLILTFVGLICIVLLSYEDYFIKYIPVFFVIQTSLLIIWVAKFLRITKILSFLGILSLEIYLIHLYKRPNYLLSMLFNIDGIYGVLLSFLFCVIVAYLLHFICNKMNNRIKYILKTNK